VNGVVRVGQWALRALAHGLPDLRRKPVEARDASGSPFPISHSLEPGSRSPASGRHFLRQTFLDRCVGRSEVRTGLNPGLGYDILHLGVLSLGPEICHAQRGRGAPRRRGSPAIVREAVLPFLTLQIRILRAS
jgi:hypothetical protein